MRGEGRYTGYAGRRGRRGGRYGRGGGYKRFNEPGEKPSAGTNRVRLNSDNFPPLISENDKEKGSASRFFGRGDFSGE